MGIAFDKHKPLNGIIGMIVQAEGDITQLGNLLPISKLSRQIGLFEVITPAVGRLGMKERSRKGDSIFLVDQ